MCVGGDASFTDNYENIQQSQEKDDREVTKEWLYILLMEHISLEDYTCVWGLAGR